MLACFFAPKASYKMTILKKVILFFSYPPAYFNSPKAGSLRFVTKFHLFLHLLFEPMNANKSIRLI